ncbi:MAG: UDP-GlcNAc:undecaprenyl-phosphate GlcNAc-1-phosphate transferase, partial [Oceanospirillaceae bacterium]
MEYSVVVVAAVAMSFIVSFFIITIGCPLSIRYGLVDMPGGRKLHSGSVPLIGGLGIFFGVFISSAIFGTYIESLNLYLLSISLLLFIGVLDDKLDLSVRFRLIAQVLISLILILGADLYLTSFGAIFHGVELKLG